MTVEDALGRLFDVWEPDPSSGTLVNETLYTYNARDELLRVDQKGGQSNRIQKSIVDQAITQAYAVCSPFFGDDECNRDITPNFRLATPGRCIGIS